MGAQALRTVLDVLGGRWRPSPTRRLLVRDPRPGTIDHGIVRAQMDRDLPAGPLRALCDRILAAGATRGGVYVPDDDLFTPGTRRVGLPLGSLLSQLWANRFLDPLDKDRLRLRGYLRYMDDMLLFHDDREALVALARQFEDACHGLRLRLRASRGVRALPPPPGGYRRRRMEGAIAPPARMSPRIDGSAPGSRGPTGATQRGRALRDERYRLPAFIHRK